MTIIPGQAAGVPDVGAVPLARYAKLVGYTEPAFFGVNHPDNTKYACREIWRKRERDIALKHLQEAQQQIEDVLGYPLQPTYVAGVLADVDDPRFVDEQSYRPTVLTKWGHVLEIGKRLLAVLSSGEDVDHTTDPAVIGPIVAATVQSVSEIRVYLPDTDIEVHPSEITLDPATHNLTIYIPRVRLVKEALLDTPSTGLDYTDTDNFTDEVDVVREYTDTSVNAQLLRPACTSAAGCSDSTQTACARIVQSDIGRVELQPATYASGTWSRSVSNLCGCGPWQMARLWYKAGLLVLPRVLEDAVVRLAHALMPAEPCGCDVVKAFWRRDRFVPEVLTRERENCPWGMSDGAWAAYRLALDMRLVRMTSLERRAR